MFKAIQSLDQNSYATRTDWTRNWLSDQYKKALAQNDLQKIDELKQRPEFSYETAENQKQRKSHSKALMTEMIKSLRKAGLTSALGYNFYDLRGPAFLEYPVNVPFRNSMARIGRVNDGVGTMAHWKATRNPFGSGTPYGGVPEGERANFNTPDENDYAAAYKELGDESGVTFTAEFAGEGYTDNLADEHLRGLHRLWLKEEAQILLGNGGSGVVGNNGFKLGTAPTPVAATPSGTGSSLTNTTKVTVAVVALTAMGNPINAQYGYVGIPTVTNGLVPSYTYTAPGSGNTITVNGGTSAISALSNSVTLTADGQSVVASIPDASLPIKGAYGYAWFVSLNGTPTLANAFLYAITTNPSVTITAAPTGTQAGNAAGLNADHSFETKDFDGLLTYAATSGTYIDLKGGSLTSEKNGRVTEIEFILKSIFDQFQCGVDAIWGSSDAIEYLDQAVRYSGTQASAYRIDHTRDNQNNMTASFVISAYQSRYAINNPMGGNAIPIRIHPMIPAGTIYFDISTVPYAHSRLSQVRNLLVQRDYYSIEWPLQSRQWTFGTYVHETLQHNLPWISAVLTGIGPFVGA